MPTEPPKKTGLHDPDSGGGISQHEMTDLLANEGYTAEKRKGWLKGVLTHESGNDADAGDPEHVKLEDEIRTILDEQLDELPVAEDGLKPKP